MTVHEKWSLKISQDFTILWKAGIHDDVSNNGRASKDLRFDRKSMILVMFRRKKMFAYPILSLGLS